MKEKCDCYQTKRKACPTRVKVRAIKKPCIGCDECQETEKELALDKALGCMEFVMLSTFSKIEKLVGEYCLAKRDKELADVYSKILDAVTAAKQEVYNIEKKL